MRSKRISLFQISSGHIKMNTPVENLFNTRHYTDDVKEMYVNDLMVACAKFERAFHPHWDDQAYSKQCEFLLKSDLKGLRERLTFNRERYATLYGAFLDTKPKKRISAVYNAYSEFEIPADVYDYLQPEPYGSNTEAVGRWYIRHNTLHYNDKEGREQEIEGTKIEVSESVKIPRVITNDEDEEVYNDE